MKDKIVLFDLDSTLVGIEGLDFLAEKKGVGESVKNLTLRSMNGEIPVEQVMPVKMQIISPSGEDMEFLADEYKNQVVQDAAKVIEELKKVGIQVGILTGNFYPAVIPLPQKLGIDLQNVFANELKFSEDGSSLGYRENNNLMHSSGKAEVIGSLRRQYKHIIHVGDSMGDLEAGADMFVGFGGVNLRQPVLENLRMGDYYIPGNSLAPLLSVSLSRRQLRKIGDKNLLQRTNATLLSRRG